MWSTAYGLIALAVVAFVVLYVAVHTPVFAPTRFADQLYYAKLAAFTAVKSASATLAKNSTYYAVINAGGWELGLPVAVWASGVYGQVNYTVFLGVLSCQNVTTASGVPSVLFEIKLYHPQVMPWLDVYALQPSAAAASYYSSLYASGKTPIYAVSDPGFQNAATADVQWQYFTQAKAEWALVRNPDGSYTLYVLVPKDYALKTQYWSIYAVYVVDYPFGAPLACAVPN